MITKEELKESLPAHLRAAVTDDLVNTVHAVSTDVEEARIYRENLVSYTSVLQEGRFKVEDYVLAVIYVSHKLMGATNQTAYKKTFPGRYQSMVARGLGEQEISAYVANYNKGKLVNLIMEQTLIPSWVLNASIYQDAINTQFRLMTSAASEKVQCEAANSILTHLKRPETKKVEIDLSVGETNGMSELKNMMAQLAQTQRDLIEAGINTREIAHQPLAPKMIDVTPTE